MAFSLKKLFGGSGGSSYGPPPEAMADPETFYSPEYQQAILDELSQDAETGRQQSQASISGQAILGGFGVGGTSREATRRAKADSDALDQIINGYVSQAAKLEDMRVQQAEMEATRAAGLEDLRANERTANRNQNQDLLIGGLGGIANVGGQMLGGRKTSKKTVYGQQPTNMFSNQSGATWSPYNPHGA